MKEIRCPDLVEPKSVVQFGGKTYLYGHAPYRYGGMSGYFPLDEKEGRFFEDGEEYRRGAEYRAAKDRKTISTYSVLTHGGDPNAEYRAGKSEKNESDCWLYVIKLVYADVKAAEAYRAEQPRSIWGTIQG